MQRMVGAYGAAAYLALLGAPVVAVVLVGGGVSPWLGVGGPGVLLTATAAGWVSVARWAGRAHRAALDAVRAALPGPTRSWGTAVAIGALVVGCATLAVATAPLQPTPNLGLARAFAVIAVVGPLVRARREPDLPGWALAVSVAWGLVAAALFAATPWLGPAGSLTAGAAWTMAAPWVLGSALRGPIGRVMERADAVGRWARAVAPLLPPAQRARAARLRGDPAAAVSILRTQLGGWVPRALAADLLDELAAALVELGDLRAIAVYAHAAAALPADPRPFVGLATTLAAHAPEAPLAWARYAETIEDRALVSGTGARAVRERLEAR